MKRCPQCSRDLPSTAYHVGQSGCKECKRTARTARRSLDVAGHRARERDYRASRRESERAYQREWKRRDRATDPAKQLEYAREYRERNRERRIGYTKAWRIRRPEAYRLWCLNHYAARKGARIRLSATDIAAMLIKQGERCFYCRAAIAGGWHLDHKTPIARGGTHERANVCVACPQCNTRKYTMTAEEFIARMTDTSAPARAEGV